MHINDFRGKTVQTYQLKNTEQAGTFFYSETDKNGALSVDEDAALDPDAGVFVLGGIAYDKLDKPVDVQSLQTLLTSQKRGAKIQKDGTFNGDFMDVLQSENTTAFLGWFLKQVFNLHFSVVDTFYWAITDIVDACLPDKEIYGNQYHQMAPKYKSDLLTVFREYPKDASRVLRKYRYPNVNPKDKNHFLTDIIYIVLQSKELSDDAKHFLCHILNCGKTSFMDEFLKYRKDQRYAKRFAVSYFNSAVLFKNARHIFDKEDSVQKILAQAPALKENAARCRHLFAVSERTPEIQISRIVTNLVGQMCAYLTRTSSKDIRALKYHKNPCVRQNIGLLRQMVLTSENQNPAFHQYLMSFGDLVKLKTLFAEDKRLVCTHASALPQSGLVAMRSLGIPPRDY